MFNRRVFVFLSLVSAALVVLLVRLAQLQIVRGPDYAEQVEKAMQYSQPLATQRGKILDRNGRPLAVEEVCHDFCLDYRSLAVLRARRLMGESFVRQWLGTNDERTRAELNETIEAQDDVVANWSAVREWVRQRSRSIAKAENIALPDGMDQAVGRFLDRLEAVLAAASRITGEPRQNLEATGDVVLRRVQAIRKIVGTRVNDERLAHPVVSGLDWATVTQLRAETDETVGAGDQGSHKRVYPSGHLACHIIGTTGSVTPAEQDADEKLADDPLGRYLVGESIGKSGVEKMCERLLRGRRGLRTFHRNDPSLLLEHTPFQPGRDVTLTLDIALQGDLTGLMQGEGRPNGAAVVLDVQTGDVLAMVSVPTYDLNSFRQLIGDLAQDSDDMRRYAANFPLINRAVAGNYPPGSTVKPISALAGSAAGVVAPFSPIYCRGYLHTPNSTRCWKTDGHGEVDMERSLAESCNVYYYTVGDRLGVDRLSEGMRQFGLGQRPGTGLPEEKAGLVPTAAWLYKREGRPFRPGDAWNMAIGQGDLEATPLQMANVVATIARGGVFLSPRIVTEGGPPQVRRELALPADALAAVQRGLFEVVNGAAGTARATAHHPSVELCGKTGTAQYSPIRGDMGWFVGYAPYRNPRIAFAIVQEYITDGGGHSCGPLAKEVVDLCRKYGYLE